MAKKAYYGGSWGSNPGKLKKRISLFLWRFLFLARSCNVSPSVPARLSHACVCVVGSQAWTPRVGGAMRVGLEASHVSSRRSGPSVSPSVMSCPVMWCTCTGKPLRRFLLRWWLGPPSGRESGQRLVISTPLLVAPAARQRARRWAGREILSLSCGMPACLPACLLACLPVYLADLTIMNGHGAHRRQEGSQLAAEPACSRRVRAPSKPWGDGCSRQVGEATTRRVTWAWGWFDFVSPDRAQVHL